MTIQSTFNEITENFGGTPSTDGTITGAIDALNDTLAGSNQDRGNSIEDAVRLLGEHIGSGGGETSYPVSVSWGANVTSDITGIVLFNIDSSDESYEIERSSSEPVLLTVGRIYEIELAGENYIPAGELVTVDTEEEIDDTYILLQLLDNDRQFVMPAYNIVISITQNK